MTSRRLPQCLLCIHWESLLDRGDDSEEPTQICKAFPEGIPDDIWWNHVDHREPVEGDHGIRWEGRDGAQFPEYAMAKE